MRTSGMLILALLLAVPTARAQSSRDPGESHKAIKVIVGASALAIGTVIVAKSSNSTTVTSPLGSSETSSFSSSQLVTGLVVAGVGGIVLWDGLRSHRSTSPSTAVVLTAGKQIGGVFVRRRW